MSMPMAATLRRESIDMLTIGGSYNDKQNDLDFVDESREESFRRLDHESKRTGEFVLQNGQRSKSDKRLSKERSFAKRWGLCPENYRKAQNYCFRFLEMPRGALCFSYHALLVILVLTSLIFTVLSTVHTKEKNYEVILRKPILAVEIILIIIFVSEYILRLWAAGCRSAFVGLKGRLWFALKLYSIIDMIVIVSSIVAISLASSVSSSPIRLLRFLPLLRVLRFDRQAGTWKLLGSVIFVHRQELLTTFYLGFISLIFASFVLYMAEKDINPDLRNWPSSFWWGIVTLTTTGYGDTVPETWYGKMCASVFALCGISFFALPAGILGSGFALKVTQQQRQKHFHRRRRPAAILLQSYWRLYCADLNSKSVATWLPSIYYNRQQHLLRSVMEKTGTTGTTFQGDNSPEFESRKRKRSMWSKPQKGLRRASYDVIKNDPNLPGNTTRKSSTCSALLDTEFFDGRSKHACDNSPDACVTLYPSQNVLCSIIHPIKSPNAASLLGDENALLALQEGEIPSIELNTAQKLAIRLIRILKLRVAIRKFKEARRPYDVKDVIEQYSTGHVEMLSRVKNLQAKIDKVFDNRIENGVDGEPLEKVGISGRLARVEQQVNMMDSKLETVLQILQNMQNTRCCPSGGSHSDDLFRGNGDGVSSRRSSVSRAHSDPLDVRTQINVTCQASDNSDIPYVTLSDPESVQSLLSDRSQGSRFSQNSLCGSLSSADRHSINQLDGFPVGELSSVNSALSRVLLPDRRQLSDVTEESITGSKETVGGLTPPGPISQQNSTASDSDPTSGGTENEAPSRPVHPEPLREGDTGVQCGIQELEQELVWERQNPVSLSPRRQRSELSLIESKLTDYEASSEQSYLLDEQKIDGRYMGTPEKKKAVLGNRSPSQRGSKENLPSRGPEAGHFDESARAAPTRMSAKRRPLVKSSPVDV
ncbi:potassium voltage-gated channel subfamily KQT member 1-like isoform X2 [Acropora muricata]|uniref:potassium voltage-gated channel subfamily KQT member 1-like isoform X2 n=1 Tax=Acropora muricata TaxID=159855 RepID=UPI0034E60338